MNEITWGQDPDPNRIHLFHIYITESNFKQYLNYFVHFGCDLSDKIMLALKKL